MYRSKQIGESENKVAYMGNFVVVGVLLGYNRVVCVSIRRGGGSWMCIIEDGSH